MKPRVRRLLALAGVGLWMLSLAACGTDPAARVNGEVITRAEHQRDVRDLMEFLATSQGIDWAADARARAELPRLRSAVLANIIDLRLVRQQAKQEGITVSERDIDARAAELIARTGGRDQFLERLQARGFTALTFREFIQDELLRERLAERHVTATAEPVEARRVRHILVDSGEKAAAARQRLAAGENWAAVAGELSQDPGSRTRGGELGFLRRGDTVPQFDQAVFALAVNDLSQPVQSPFGYHILQVTETRLQPLTPEQAESVRQRAFDQYLQTVRQQATIEEFAVEAALGPGGARP